MAAPCDDAAPATCPDDDYGVLRHASAGLKHLRPYFDQKLRRFRAPTPAFLLRKDKETGDWENTLSVDLENALREAGKPLYSHVREGDYLARVSLAGINSLGLGVIADPVPGNDEHGGITDIPLDHKGVEVTARALAKLSTLPPDDRPVASSTNVEKLP